MSEVRGRARQIEVVGRESQLAGFRELGTADSAASAWVLTGGPGIGKTTLWEAGIAARARARAARALAPGRAVPRRSSRSRR